MAALIGGIAMKNPVIRAAQKFINRTLKGKTDTTSITAYLQSIGYTVSLYEAKDEDNLIEKYELDSRAKIVHAFTVEEGNVKFVYVNNALSPENKRYAILHETGHIVLGHLISDDLIVNDRLREMEAEAFAYMVLNPPKQNRTLLALLILLIVLLVANLLPVPASVQTSSLNNSYTAEMSAITDNQIEYVYITPSGKKYHRENCFYTKGKECTMLSKKEARKNYEPCLVCNP